MALPNGFNNSHEYFHQVNEFLKQYSWIYRAANTEFLKAGIFNEMPQEFQDYFVTIETEDLNKFPYVHEPLANLQIETLINFRQKLAELIPLEAYSGIKDIENSIKLENLKKINRKKRHEIQRLAAVVKESIEGKNNVNAKVISQQKYVLIDFGSGLGYLSELLYKQNNEVLIFGLEADAYRVQAADKRIKTYMPFAINSIQHRQHFITENSKDFILATAEEVFKLNYQQIAEQTTTKMAIIGLHACADLTITSMKLFLQLPQVQQLIIMPCCYHKLLVCDNAAADATSTQVTTNLKFRNFPISESFKKVLSSNKDNHNGNANWVTSNETFTMYLNRPFLRLACQQTLKRWSKCSVYEHQAHGSEMFFRALAELLIEQDKDDVDLVIVKRKKEGKEKFDFSSLSAESVESFESFSRIFALKRNATNELVDWSERHKKKFSEIIEKYSNGSKMAEGLTCLQTSMQKLCENLVLYDRLCFMEETSLKMNLKINVRYEKIMDEELSPRCHVLIAEKL